MLNSRLFFSKLTLALTRIDDQRGEGGGEEPEFDPLLLNLTFQNAGRVLWQYPFLRE